MLIGNKVKLRALNIADSKKTVVWRNDLELIAQTQGIRFPKSLILESNWFESILQDKSDRSIFLGIETVTDHNLIGIIQATNIDYLSGTCVLGIVIGDQSMRGQGAGRESMELMLKYLYDTINLRKISLSVVHYNDSAIKLYQKMGFLQEGVLREHFFWDAKYHDVLLLAHFRKDYIDEL